MNALENLYSRRSIRSYNGEAITDSELQEILKAAYAAPVGRALYDTLHITVITNKDYLSKWEKATAVAFGNPDMHPFYGASTLILISSASANGQLGNVHYSNAAIVAHNMSLAAADMGVGQCLIWGAVGVMNTMPELVAELGLPEGMTPCCSVAFGHTDEKYSLREVPADRIQTAYMK